MAKRDIIAEIEGVRNRNDANMYRYEVAARLRDIESFYSEKPSVPEEARRYVPIALVACIEGFTRGAIRELCSYNVLYLERALKGDSFKLETDFLVAIQNRKVTAGDIVSHLLPISRLESISDTFRKLLEADFLNLLKSAKQRNFDGSESIIIDKFPDTIKAVRGIFEMRHIFAHEANSKTPITPSLVDEIILHTSKFLSAYSSIIESITNPDAPISQAEINQRAYADLGESQLILEETVNSIRKYVADREPAVVEGFESSIKAWQDFSEVDARFQGDITAFGGSLSAAVYASHKKELTEQRLKSLEWIQKLVRGVNL